LGFLCLPSCRFPFEILVVFNPCRSRRPLFAALTSSFAIVSAFGENCTIGRCACAPPFTRSPRRPLSQHLIRMEFHRISGAFGAPPGPFPNHMFLCRGISLPPARGIVELPVGHDLLQPRTARLIFPRVHVFVVCTL